ncbi:hypothetical protein HNP46_005542 [Pseudomonas nitritireducens]|uniref:Uncharacterized protein n=1 Tax=Pseudomonas nitroreducens TaxID=46680 RepID=A0A7W7KPM0_PSENT|nr:hypothetical protein [Pseudomonas nitritireducens]
MLLCLAFPLTPALSQRERGHMGMHGQAVAHG